MYSGGGTAGRGREPSVLDWTTCGFPTADEAGATPLAHRHAGGSIAGPKGACGALSWAMLLCCFRRPLPPSPPPPRHPHPHYHAHTHTPSPPRVAASHTSFAVPSVYVNEGGSTNACRARRCMASAAMHRVQIRPTSAPRLMKTATSPWTLQPRRQPTPSAQPAATPAAAAPRAACTRWSAGTPDWMSPSGRARAGCGCCTACVPTTTRGGASGRRCGPLFPFLKDAGPWPDGGRQPLRRCAFAC
jgi:hypothetical protein